MTKFFDKTDNHCARLIGDDIRELTTEAMRHVRRLRSYYEQDIMDNLAARGNAIVSGHSSAVGTLVIVLDECMDVSDDEWRDWATKEIERKYGMKLL